MADTVTRFGPLSAAAGRLAATTRASGGALRLAELPFLTQIDLRLDPGGPAAEAAGLALGAPLPLEPCTAVRTGDLAVLWLGPDQWLVVGPPGSQEDLEARLRKAAGEAHVSVTDVSAQRTTLLVSGPRARDLLAHGCSLDLHPRVFPPAAARRPRWPAPRWCWWPGRRYGRASGCWSAPPSPATSPTGCWTPPRSTCDVGRTTPS